MEHKFKFEKLIIWQKAMGFGEDINTLAEHFPKKELFNLASQICRASDSIALNISEGSIGQSVAEQKKFTGYAIRSHAEVVTCLHKAKRRRYIDISLFDEKYTESFHLMNMLIGFRNSLRYKTEVRR